MDLDSKKILKTLNPNKIWIPVLIGLGIVFYLFYSDPDFTAKKLRLVFTASPVPIVLAVLVIFARDLGYIYRIRTITGKSLSWKSSVYVIILWEFASAVTPSVVGGTAVAVFILLKEGISLGRSMAYVMLTAILDNMFFILAAPIIFLSVEGNVFPRVENVDVILGKGLDYLFFLSYSLIALYTVVMSLALFVRPRLFKWILLKITNIRFLKRWRIIAARHGDEIILASAQLKHKNKQYWFKIIMSTVFIWSARYIMLNCLVAAFAPIDFTQHLFVFARQIIMWVVMLVSPTPGSSGTAELFFIQFFTRFLGDYTYIANILWRMFSYYPYLLLGVIFLPRWVRKVFFKKEKNEIVG